jgi:hypothetical protein
MDFGALTDLRLREKPIHDENRELGLSAVSDEIVEDLVRDMDKLGVAILPNFVPARELAELQAFVEGAVEAAGGQYVVFNGKDAVSGTLLERISDSAVFQSLAHRVYERGSGQSAPNQSVYQVLRCLKGETGARHAYIFHFDSFVLTVLLPIVIPSQGRMGHLVMAPNIRPIRRSYLGNLIDKVLLDNALTQQLLKLSLRFGWPKFQRIRMVPGNLYLFWGYRSLHTNEACDPENIRATALYHFGDPHAASPLRRGLGRAVTA